MLAKKPFKLNRGCAIALVLSWAVMIVLGFGVVRLSQLPNELDTGLGRAGRLMNILVSADVGHRVMLTVHTGKIVYIEFLDRPGVYRAEDIAISDDEWQVLNAAYQQWCTNPPHSGEQDGSRVYDIGISCSSDFGRHIQVQETQLPPEVSTLFKRAARQ
jgi:hypothetical protein